MKIGVGRLIRRVLVSRMGRRAYESLAGLATEVRVAALKASLKSCGQRVSIQMPAYIAQPESVEVGSDVSLGAFVHIWGAGGVRVGDRTMIGSHSAISTITHDYHAEEMQKTVVLEPVVIGSDAWIGAHAVVLPGVSIGVGAVVGAGSVVTRNVDSGSIVAGVPAKEIGRRDKAPATE